MLWDRATGRPVHRAIVWQDRRTATACAALRRRGLEPLVQRRTGLLLDPYFSGTKLAWLLDHVPGARRRAVRGELEFSGHATREGSAADPAALRIGGKGTVFGQKFTVDGRMSDPAGAAAAWGDLRAMI